MGRSVKNIIIRPVNEVCNLSCTYCNSLPYATNQKMSLDLLEAIIYEASLVEDSFISFCWHGGEPLLAGLEFYKKIVEFQFKYFGGIFRDGRCENIVQTNALLLNPQFIEFFKLHSFHIGVSLDGPDLETNKYRFPKHSASKLFKKTKDKISLLVRNGINVSVINVIHQYNMNKWKELYYFYSKNIIKVVNTI